MRNPLHCDVCKRSCLYPLDEVSKSGWLGFGGKSVSGVPNYLLCPDCLKEHGFTGAIDIIENQDKKQRKLSNNN